MSDFPAWQVHPLAQPPEWFVQSVGACAPGIAGPHTAQLLWQRGIQDPQRLAGFLNAEDYPSTSPFAFGQEMDWAIARLQHAHEQGEVVGIWGDFDADGVTATAVLWDGLGQFFTQQKTLFYYIPNRLTESHGLSQQGIDQLHARGCRLMVTCDTGSTNLEEIAYAHQLGIEVIITDHHTLSVDRPPVVAILNPRYLPRDHPLATLSGVAVAYKLVEALYTTLPKIPQQPLGHLLDLVAIGLIADLVELKGDCRYLAQRGIEQLQKQASRTTATRPGIFKLLELCKRSGDRPTDISFGLGPRINAVSRIQGDAHFCVELLTSQDPLLCNHLAEATELANSRRKALQKEVAQQVSDRLAQLDLSTTSVIVLADEQWQTGVLGLVAGQIAQEYHRPTILLTIEGAIARGSARSVNHIDLYQLVHEQRHLLQRFGGHPYAAGLCLAVENLSLFTDAINRKLRQVGDSTPATLPVDLTVTAAELGKALFQELKLLEPYGIGNPVPKLLVKNCRFEKVWHRRIKDWKGQQVQYIKTEFELGDDSASVGVPGVWWGHYKDEIPSELCDAVVELDWNSYQKRYEVRLVALRPAEPAATTVPVTVPILDWRTAHALPVATPPPLILTTCPGSWTEVQLWYRRALNAEQPLAIAYPSPPTKSPQTIWQELVGIAKYLSRTGKTATRQQLSEKLSIGDRTLQLGFQSLVQLGFTVRSVNHAFEMNWQAPVEPPSEAALATQVEQFLAAVREEQFRRQYFYQVPLSTIQAFAGQPILGNN